jgi:hypothetical protein
MFGAAVLALLQSAGNMPADSPLPQIADIQYALGKDWIMQSSSGMQFNDYAVRNVVCTETPLKKVQQVIAKKPLAIAQPDAPLSAALCSFDYALQKMKKPREPDMFYEPTVRQFSKRDLARIPKNLWKSETHLLVRYSRDLCRYISRIPEPGTCVYWRIED